MQLEKTKAARKGKGHGDKVEISESRLTTKRYRCYIVFAEDAGDDARFAP